MSIFQEEHPSKKENKADLFSKEQNKLIIHRTTAEINNRNNKTEIENSNKLIIKRNDLETKTSQDEANDYYKKRLTKCITNLTNSNINKCLLVKELDYFSNSYFKEAAGAEKAGSQTQHHHHHYLGEEEKEGKGGLEGLTRELVKHDYNEEEKLTAKQTVPLHNNKQNNWICAGGAGEGKKDLCAGNNVGGENLISFDSSQQDNKVYEFSAMTNQNLRQQANSNQNQFDQLFNFFQPSSGQSQQLPLTHNFSHQNDTNQFKPANPPSQHLFDFF